MKYSDGAEATALANSYPPLLLEDYNRLEQTVSREFRWYLIGLTSLFAKKKSFQSDKLNNLLTKARVAQNSGYAEGTMTRFICYANAIARLQKSFPDLAGDILAGKTRLGLKTTILLSKQSPEDIIEIIKRVEVENTPVRRIISERIKRPLSYPRRFSDGRSTKSSPQSIKDNPRYDPDAQITGLTYTIPSWVKTINRLRTNEKLCESSNPAQKKLRYELANLSCAAEALIELIMEAQQ